MRFVSATLLFLCALPLCAAANRPQAPAVSTEWLRLIPREATEGDRVAIPPGTLFCFDEQFYELLLQAQQDDWQNGSNIAEAISEEGINKELCFQTASDVGIQIKVDKEIRPIVYPDGMRYFIQGECMLIERATKKQIWQLVWFVARLRVLPPSSEKP